MVSKHFIGQTTSAVCCGELELVGFRYTSNAYSYREGVSRLSWTWLLWDARQRLATVCGAFVDYRASVTLGSDVVASRTGHGIRSAQGAEFRSKWVLPWWLFHPRVPSTELSLPALYHDLDCLSALIKTERKNIKKSKILPIILEMEYQYLISRFNSHYFYCSKTIN